MSDWYFLVAFLLLLYFRIIISFAPLCKRNNNPEKWLKLLNDDDMNDIEDNFLLDEYEVQELLPAIGLLDTMLAQEESRIKKMALPIIFGKAGKKVFSGDLAGLPHLLVGGASGMGKSNFLKCLISTLTRLRGSEADFTLFDPMEIEFHQWVKFKSCKVISEVKELTAFLDEILKLMKERRALFIKKNVVQLSEYNRLANTKKIKYKVLVVDEYAQVFSEPDVQKKLISLSQIGRKFGVHIVLATQRPDANVIHTQIRANFTECVAFGVRDEGNAKVLGAKGAHKIREKGVALVRSGPDLIKVKTPLFEALKEPLGF